MVRAYLGHERLDTAAQTQALNALYDQMWLYYNLFQPVMRLAEKIVIRDKGQISRVRRRFDTAQTPFDSLCAAGGIQNERHEELTHIREMINPRQLKREIYDSLHRIFMLPNAAPGVTEDVYLTLCAAPVP